MCFPKSTGDLKKNLFILKLTPILRPSTEHNANNILLIKS